MDKIDKLDCKILYELGDNSRQSYKQIARNIHSKKEVVAYHFQQLIKKRIITKFVPVFALSRLGVFSSKMYIKLKGLKKEDEKELFESLVNDKKIAWVARCLGNWDLLLGMYSRNIIEFGRLKEQILNKHGKHFRSYEITHIEDGLVFNRDYLIDKKTDYRDNFLFGGNIAENKLNKEELNIINFIKNNARFTSLEIANKFGIDARTVLKIINNLKKKQILQGYTVFIDLKKLGLQLHKLCFYLENHNEKDFQTLMEYLKQNKRVIHLIKSQGSWELEAEIEDSNLEHIYSYVTDLKNIFPDFIREISLVSITDEMKLDFFPDDLN